MQSKPGFGGGRKKETVKTSDHVALSAGPLAHLLALCADLDGVGDQLSRLFLLQACYFLQLDGNLRRTGRSEGARALPALGPLLVPTPAHCCLPAKDVAVEADPVLREIEAALEKDLTLQGTGVI